MLEIGRLNKLRVLKEVDFGVYLDGEEFGEILLPKKYVPKNCRPGSIIEVFIYLDSEDRIIATTQKPYAMVGEFAELKVVSVSAAGAFLDWGLQKDLLVPFREQKQKMIKGKSYVVYVYFDEKSDRIAASAKLHKYLGKAPIDFRPGEDVDLLIYDETGMGYNAIINNTHMGLIYKNDIFQTLETGQKIKGYIKNIREDDKIDLLLQKPGYEKVDDISKKILELIKQHDGFVSVTDKSPPEVIYKTFGVSKKTYKKAIGALFKKRLITIEDDGIKLIR
jgi:predicted RNA-binding protein (virulence factor B family)